MLSEQVQYLGKANFFNESSKQYFLKYWQVQTRQVFAQTVTYTDYLAIYRPIEALFVLFGIRGIFGKQ